MNRSSIICGECGEPKHWYTDYEKAAFEHGESRCIDCDRIQAMLSDAAYRLLMQRKAG